MPIIKNRKIKIGVLKEEHNHVRLKLTKAVVEKKVNIEKRKQDKGFHIKGGGFSINGKKIVVKSIGGHRTIGFNKKLGKVVTKKDLGKTFKGMISYVSNKNDTEQSEQSLYSETGKLEEADIEKLLDSKKELVGVHHIMISTGQDLDKDENAVLVRETMARFKEETGKNFDYVFAFHTDTDNNHAHIILSADKNKNDVIINGEQLQLLKVITAEETVKMLDRRDEEVSEVDRQLIFEKEKYANIKKANEIQNEFKDEKAKISTIEQYDYKISFNEQYKSKFNEDDLKAFQELQKAKGYKTFLERNNEDGKNDPKIEWADKKIEESYTKLNDKFIEQKLNDALDEFKKSEPVKDIHTVSTNERVELAGTIGKRIEEETTFKNQVEKLQEREEKNAFKGHKEINAPTDKSIIDKVESMLVDKFMNDEEKLERNIKFNLNSAVDSLLKTKEELEAEKQRVLQYGNASIDEIKALEIQELLKTTTREAEGKTNLSNDAFDKSKIVAAERNELKQSGATEEDNLLFKQKQQEFMNLKIVENNGLSQASLQEWKDKSVSMKTRTSIDADKFIANTNEHADKLVSAGILEKKANGDYSFTDERAREILLEHADKPVNQILDKNLEDLKMNDLEINEKHSLNDALVNYDSNSNKEIHSFEQKTSMKQ